jgi:chemotaxis signal transduction protein
MSGMASELVLSEASLRRAFDSAFAAPSSKQGQELQRFLMLRIASRGYAMRVLEIAGFATARKIVPLASALPALLGLTALRGRFLPVYSLERLLGVESADVPPRWFVVCGGADPVALGFAEFEGHVLLSRPEVFAATDGASPRKYARELVRTADGVRGVIDVSSLLEAIRQRVSASEPVKER